MSLLKIVKNLKYYYLSHHTIGNNQHLAQIGDLGEEYQSSLRVKKFTNQEKPNPINSQLVPARKVHQLRWTQRKLLSFHKDKCKM
jgi:hypothetical protein